MELPAKYVVPLKRYGDRALCFPQNQTEMRGLAFRRFKRYCKIKNRIKKQYKFYENLNSSTQKIIRKKNIEEVVIDFDANFEKALSALSQEEANGYWKKAQWDGATGFSNKGDASWVWLVNINHLFFVRDNLNLGSQKIQPHDHDWPIMDFIENWHWEK